MASTPKTGGIPEVSLPSMDSNLFLLLFCLKTQWAKFGLISDFCVDESLAYCPRLYTCRTIKSVWFHINMYEHAYSNKFLLLVCGRLASPSLKGSPPDSPKYGTCRQKDLCKFWTPIKFLPTGYLSKRTTQHVEMVN